MRPHSLAFALLLFFLSRPSPAQNLFDVPLRINMGGAATVDSYGRLWLGDGPGGGDPLNIRPDDRGGANWFENWELGNFQPEALLNLGFDPAHPGDAYIFNTIRWDDAGVPGEFRLEIPIPDGDYLVNMYFTEGCCTFRHFKIEIQGTILDDDVSYLDYDILNPALGRTGRLSFPDITVNDNILRIGLLPCPACPGGGDSNAIIDALEVLSADGCDHQGLDFNCAFDPAADQASGAWFRLGSADGYRILKNGQPLGADLPATASSFTDPSPRSGGVLVRYTLLALDGGAPFLECGCSVTAAACPGGFACAPDPATGEVALSWDLGGGKGITGFELRANGDLIQTLPASATTFEDIPATRATHYLLTPISDPPGECQPLPCTAAMEGLLFDTPLFINMGGPTTADSQGRIWLGDGPGPGDPLAIRLDDLGGMNTIENWCAPNPVSLQNLGLDPNHAGDRQIFSTIRYDLGIDGIDYRLALPLPNNDYEVNLYFNECCCPCRHFQIEIQGDLIEPDVSMALYDPVPAAGKIGRLSYAPIPVTDEVLNIALLPCPDGLCSDAACPGGNDINAILNAIEVLETEPPCDRPESKRCPSSLICAADGAGKITGGWDPGRCITVSRYEVRRNGELVKTLPGSAASFTDEPPGCQRSLTYELEAFSDEPDFPCAARKLRCDLLLPECPFSTPLRINMGGSETVDSHGDVWLGDGPGPGDPLQIRPDDAGGTNTIEGFSLAVFQPDSIAALGFDPGHEGDVYIFNSIRWDDGAAPPDYVLHLPLENGTYTANLYFNEGCCPGRHFKIEIQGDIVENDVSYLNYDPTTPAIGRAGRLSFPGVVVADNLLRIGLLPCPGTECPGSSDVNAILDALEILSEKPEEAPDPPTGLLAAAAGNRIDLAWTAPAGGPPFAGYNVYRSVDDGPPVKINPIAISATQFADAAADVCKKNCYVVRSVTAGGKESIDSSQACAAPPPSCGAVSFKRGDVDANGAVEITDPINLLGFLFLGEAQPPCFDAADADDNGALEITDAIVSLGFQFLGELPPPDPGPFACGPDPSAEVPGADFGCVYPPASCGGG